MRMLFTFSKTRTISTWICGLSHSWAQAPSHDLPTQWTDPFEQLTMSVAPQSSWRAKFYPTLNQGLTRISSMQKDTRKIPSMDTFLRVAIPNINFLWFLLASAIPGPIKGSWWARATESRWILQLSRLLIECALIKCMIGTWHCSILVVILRLIHARHTQRQNTNILKMVIILLQFQLMLNWM